MDIFVNKEENLAKFMKTPLQFTELEPSTATVEGYMSNVEHREDELINLLECEGDIVKIDSNFGHLTLSTYKEKSKEKTSNRGRKRKPKPVKTRKTMGDGSGFNSQISFTVLGDVIRPKTLFPDKYSAKAELSEKSENGIIKTYESFIKEYKIKVFRNGKYTVPGALTEDLSDVRTAISKLCKYLGGYFLENVEISNMFSVMRNYKFRLTTGKVDIKKLHRFCTTHFQSLLNTRFSDIEDYLINPIFDQFSIPIISDTATELDQNIDLNITDQPNTVGWNIFLNDLSESVEDIINRSKKMKSPDVKLNIENLQLNMSISHFKETLKNSKSGKNLFVDFKKLSDRMNDIPLENIYRKVITAVFLIQKNHFITLNDNTIKNLVRYSLQDQLTDLEKYLTKSKDNMLSHIKYNVEIYPGFIIKIKTPSEKNPNKRTTVKIFSGGKINVDGCNNWDEAMFIYYWLNNLFYENPEFIYDFQKIENYDEHDSEFSSESENEQNETEID